MQKGFPKPWTNWQRLRPIVTVCALILTGCAQTMPPLGVPCPQMPELPAQLSGQRSPDAQNFSSEVQSWLSEVREWQANTLQSVTP